MAMELFEKGTYMYSLMADYWVLNRKLLTQNYENRAVYFYRCAGILRSMLYALCDHVKILSTNLQYLGFTSENPR